MISMDFFFPFFFIFYEMPLVAFALSAKATHSFSQKKSIYFLFIFLFFHKEWGYRQQINMFHSILTNFGAESPFSALNLFCLLQ